MCPRSMIQHDGVCFLQEKIETGTYAEAQLFCNNMQWAGIGSVAFAPTYTMFYLVNALVRPYVSFNKQ